MQKQILVVDDDPLFIDLVRDVFAIEAIDVISASDANAALSILNAARPTFIVSDFEMAGMDGMEFHSRLLGDEKTKDIPFVFMTGSSDQALIQYAKQHRLRLLSKNNLVNELIGLFDSLK